MSLVFIIIVAATSFDRLFIGSPVTYAYSILNMLHAYIVGGNTMITMQTVMEQLTGEEIYNTLIHVMTNEFEDFAVTRKQYENTTLTLQSELGNDTVPTVKDAMDAIQQQTVSNLLFSGAMGIKDNLDNFINPLTKNFLDVDSEIYLREETARRLPAYEQARKVLERFYALLSPDQQMLYEDIIAYISHLETTGPKLAHYYGYLLGNELLPRIVPGYHMDTALTLQYRIMLRDYFGKKINLE